MPVNYTNSLMRWYAALVGALVYECLGQDMHAPTERIRADSIATGAAQLRAVLAEVLEPYPNPRN